MSDIKKDPLKPSIEQTEAKVVGQIFDREAVLASVNEAFNDYEKFKATNPDADVEGILFLMVSGSEKAERNEVQCSMGGNRGLLFEMFMRHLTMHATKNALH